MPTTTSPTHRCAPARIGARAITAATTTLVVVTTLVAWAGAAAAQSATTPPVTTPAENPGSTAAGFVFFGVTGAIIIGALLLYLRNRRPRVASEG